MRASTLAYRADGVTCGYATYHRPRGTMDRLLKERRGRHRDTVQQLFQRWSRRYETYWHGVERGEWMKYPGPPRTDRDWKRSKALVVRKLFSPSRPEPRSPRFARTTAKIFQELFPLYAFSALEGADRKKLPRVPSRLPVGAMEIHETPPRRLNRAPL